MRKFGVEIELNSFDKRNFKKHPLSLNEMPKGIFYVKNLIKKYDQSVQVTKWQNTHNNKSWICKPDSSCGIEVCSPVINNSKSFKNLLKIIDKFNQDSKISVDHRCSLHVHYDVSDLIKNYEFVCILVWWIKCEMVLMDMVPFDRKINSFCQTISFLDFFNYNEKIDVKKIFNLLGRSKYFTINTYHMKNKRRNTIEFRILEGKGCVDSDLCKNWILFLNLFIEQSLRNGIPKKFYKNNYWTSFYYLETIQFFDFLGFLDSNLSLEKKRLRDWVYQRMKQNIETNQSGFWNKKYRNFSICQLEEIRFKYLTN
jgi:hypothetical protein